MKYGIVLFIILFPVFALAQGKVYNDSTSIDLLKRNVWADLKDSWTLGIDSNSGEVDIRVYNKYKSLFDSGATVPDDMNVFYQLDPSGRSGTYKTSTTQIPFEIYAHDLALQLKGIAFDSIITVDSAATLNTLEYTIRRTAIVQKTGEFVIQDTTLFVDTRIKSRKDDPIEFEIPGDADKMKKGFMQKLKNYKDSVYRFGITQTLHIIIKYDRYNDGDSSCKIISIKNIPEGYKISCLNDDDNDAVLNQDDRSENPGEFTANGRPDADFDGVPDDGPIEGKDNCPKTFGLKNHGCPLSYFSTKNQAEVFVGLQLNAAKINLPELNNLGYRDASGRDAIDVLQSKKGVLLNPGSVTGICAGGSYAYFFGGKRKRTGISVGFTYSGFTARYTLTEPIVYTFKSSDGINDYRRQIAINSLAEEIGYSVFNFPVLFNYRSLIGKENKTVFNFKAGPSLVLFRNTSNYNATIDFGGLYQVDSVNRNKITFYDHFDQGSSWNVLVTPSGINSQNTNPGANSVFAQLFTNSKNYDFAGNKNYRDKTSLTRATVALNVALDVQRQISPGVAIKAGAHFLYAPLFEKKEKYIPVNKTTDTYNSIYNSTAASSYSAFGMNVGFVYNF